MFMTKDSKFERTLKRMVKMPPKKNVPLNAQPKPVAKGKTKK